MCCFLRCHRAGTSSNHATWPSSNAAIEAGGNRRRDSLSPCQSIEVAFYGNDNMVMWYINSKAIYIGSGSSEQRQSNFRFLVSTVVSWIDISYLRFSSYQNAKFMFNVLFKACRRQIGTQPRLYPKYVLSFHFFRNASQYILWNSFPQTWRGRINQNDFCLQISKHFLKELYD